MTYTYAVGFLIFVSMVKFLRLLRLNVKIVELSSTLSFSLNSMIAFFVYLVIVLCAFGQWVYAVFGCGLAEYRTFITTLETLISMMMMNFNYHAIVTYSPLMGNLFFTLYILFVGFVLLSMMVAILDESACAVREGELLSSDDYKLVDYMFMRLRLLLHMDMETHKSEGKTE